MRSFENTHVESKRSGMTAICKLQKRVMHQQGTPCYDTGNIEHLSQKYVWRVFHLRNLPRNTHNEAFMKNTTTTTRRTNVARRAARRSHQLLLGLEVLRQPEVCDFDLVIFGIHQVLWLPTKRWKKHKIQHMVTSSSILGWRNIHEYAAQYAASLQTRRMWVAGGIGGG